MPAPNTPDRRSAADPLPRTGSMTALQVPERVFDSHRFVKRLTAAGMEEGLAEVLAEEHMGPWIRNVATRADVANIREDLDTTRVAVRKDLDNLRKDAATKADVASLRKDLDNLRKDAATKADVASLRKDFDNLRKDAATKADLASLRKDFDNLRKDAATKADVASLRKDLENAEANIRRDMATKADLANAIAAAERRLMIAMIGVAGVLFAALRLTQ